MSQPKWKKASYSSIQVKDTSLSAKTGTIKKLRSTDIDVSTIHGSNSIGVSTNINDTSYNTSKYSALTISAEAIQYQGGGKPENIMVGGTTYEQYIQPLIFENKSGIAEIKARGALAHISEISNEDITTPLNAFGLFSAPNENLILTVAQDNGIFDYIDGNKSNSLSYTKTGIFIDKSNRIFMGISGEDLTSDKLDYLVKGNKEAQLYVKGDIVVDGSGVQIDKYIVDDILVGESVAIMGNHLDPSGMVNDISAVVPNLEGTLSDKETDTKKQGYLMVANNTYLYSDLIFPTSDVSNSGDKITGSIQFKEYTSSGAPDGDTICSISAFNNEKRLDISGSNKINMHSTNNIDISSGTIQMYGTDISMQSSDNIDISSGTIQMYGTDISMQSSDNINMQSTNNIDISSGTIQMYGTDISMQSTNNIDISSGTIQMYGTDISMQSTNNIDISSENIQLIVSSQLPQPSDDGTGLVTSQPPISNSITYSYSTPIDASSMALAIINVGHGNTPGAYTELLNESDSSMAIPTVNFVKSRHYWKPYEDSNDTITLNQDYFPDLSNINVPGKVECSNLHSTNHFRTVTVCGIEETTVYWWIFPIGVELQEVCHTVVIEDDGPPPYVTDFSSTVFFNKPVTMRYGSTNDLSLTDSALYIAPADASSGSASASMSLISHKGDGVAEQNATIYFGTRDGSNSINNIGAIQGESDSNMVFYGSSGQDLQPFMTYTGSTNKLDFSSNDVSFNLSSSGHIYKSTYSTATDPSNSLVDLSFVLNYIDTETYWESKSSTSGSSLSYIKTKSTSKPVLINYHDQAPQFWSNQIFGLTVESDKSNTNDGAIAVISSRNVAEPSTHAGAVVYLGNHNDADAGTNPHIGDNSGTYLLGGIRGYYPGKSDLSNIGNVQLFGSNDGINNHVFMEYDGCNNNIDISSGTIQMYGTDISMQSSDNINMQSTNIHMSPTLNIDMQSSNIDMECSHNIGMNSTNNIDISSGTIQMFATDVSFNLSSSGHIYKSTYSQESDPSNSLVDLSFVLTHVSGSATYWEPVPNTSNSIQPKNASTTEVHGLSFNATSDAVKKENIRTISGALESIDHLRGVTYNLKADETQKTHHGVIAQEIEQIFPDMVAGTEGNKSVAYMEIIGVLIEAVKDLKTRVEELENK